MENGQRNPRGSWDMVTISCQEREENQVYVFPIEVTLSLDANIIHLYSILCQGMKVVYVEEYDEAASTIVTLLRKVMAYRDLSFEIRKGRLQVVDRVFHFVPRDGLPTRTLGSSSLQGERVPPGERGGREPEMDFANLFVWGSQAERACRGPQGVQASRKPEMDFANLFVWGSQAERACRGPQGVQASRKPEMDWT
jgi:hypothetical protein